MSAGRLLRLMRLAAGMSLEAAAVDISVSPMRLRALERDRIDLGYLEGLALAKAYLLCPTCFARHFRTAVAHDPVENDVAPPASEATS